MPTNTQLMNYIRLHTWIHVRYKLATCGHINISRPLQKTIFLCFPLDMYVLLRIPPTNYYISVPYVYTLLDSIPYSPQMQKRPPTHQSLKFNNSNHNPYPNCLKRCTKSFRTRSRSRDAQEYRVSPFLRFPSGTFRHDLARPNPCNARWL